MSALKSLRRLSTAPLLIAKYHIKLAYNRIKYRNYPNRLKRAIEMTTQSHRNRLTMKLEKKYKNFIKQQKIAIDSAYYDLPHEHPKNIWIYWAQGIENAPDIVKVCVQSAIDKFKGGGVEYCSLIRR